MATIGTATTSSHLNTPRRSYFTTSNYNQNFYTLQSSVNSNTYQTTYSLVVNPKGSPANCGSNAILRETGKKIYPGQYPGVNSYYVSVFDDASHITGFINPNNPLFLPLNTDKPSDVYSPNGVSDDAEEGNYGPPVNTKGTINSHGYISTQSYLHVNEFALVDQYISSGQYVHANQFVLADSYLQAGTYLSTGTYANIGTYLSTGTYVRAGTYVAGAAVTLNTANGGSGNGDVYLNPTLGNIFVVSITTGFPTDTKTLYLYIGSDPSTPILPPAGERITIVFPGLSTGSYYTVDLANTGATAGQLTVNQQRYIVVPVNTTQTITYISNGSQLIETSRSSSSPSGGGSSGGSSIVSYGTLTGTGANSYTINTPYATNRGKIFLTDQTTTWNLCVTAVVPGVSFTVTCYGVAGTVPVSGHPTIPVPDQNAPIPLPSPQGTSGTFNWMIIA